MVAHIYTYTISSHYLAQCKQPIALIDLLDLNKSQVDLVLSCYTNFARAKEIIDTYSS